MLPAFEQNAAYIWAIYAIGALVPVGLTVFALVRARIAKRRLDRLQAEGKSAS